MTQGNLNYGKPLKGLNTRQGIIQDLVNRGYNVSDSFEGDYIQRETQDLLTTPSRQEIGFAGLGESSYDSEITSASQLDDLEDTRGRLQPWYSQIGAGIAKGAILAGTTFLDGTIGTILGAINALDKKEFNAFWNNDFGKAMKAVNDWSEQALPNYRTEEERINDENGEWYKNIATANWWGDKFIKNLGFTAGAFATGNLVTSALGKAPGIVKSIVGSSISAINEGKVEALNNSEEFYKEEEKKLKDYYTNKVQNLYLEYGDTPEFQDKLQEYANSYDESLAKLNENKAKMGNVDFLLNLPILMASNMFMWGKLYAGGSKNAISSMNIAKRDGKYIGKSNISKVITSPLSEGSEEMTQGMAKEIPSIYYGNEFENFYKAKFDKDAEQTAINAIQATGKGIANILGESSSWEEFAIGALTGAIGMPKFRSTKNSEGKWQSPITIEGGIIGEYNDYKENKKDEQRVVDYLNNRVANNEDFLNYYQGYIRHNKYQNDMDKAAEENDTFEFKNAEESQLISDIIMFDKAGYLNDLNEMLEQAYDTSDENIEAIIRNTTDKDGNGPFSQNGNTWGKPAILQEINRTKDDIQSKIESYKNIKNNHLRLLGDKLEDEQLAELTWLAMKHENYKNRFNQVVDEIREVLKTNNAVIEKKTDKTIKELLELDNESLISTLSSKDNKEFITAQNILRKSLEKDYNLNAVDIENKLSDLKKLADKTTQFYNRYMDLTKNPNKIIESTEATNEEVDSLRNEEELQKRKESIISSTSFKDLQDKIDTGEIDSQDLENSDIRLAKEFIESSKFKYLVDREIDSSDNTDEEKEQLKEMVNTKFNDYNNYSDFSNSNLNVDLMYENQDELDYKLKSILDKVNKDTDSINSLKVGTVINPKKEASSMIKDTTGNDKNSDVPSIKTNNEFSNIISDLDNQPSIVQEELKPIINNVRNLYNKAKSKNTQEDYNNAIDSINTLISYVESEGSTITSDTEFLERLNNSLYKVLDKIPDYNTDTTNEEVLNYLDKDIDIIDKNNNNKKEKKYYSPIIPEFSINELKQGEFKPFNVTNPEYSPIYEYLEKAGAFKYINEGNLKTGDKLDLKLERIGDYDEVVMYKGTQVIGTLPSLKTANNNNYIGLPKVIERVKNGDNIQLTVNKILLGKYRYNRETPQSVKNLNKEDLKIGIQENPFGSVTTNTKDIVEPVYNEQNAAGKVYILLPNSRGTLSPKLVRVKHFNKEEFDLVNLKDKGNTRAIAIDNIIKELSKVDNIDKATKQLNNLRRVLHLDKTFHLNFEEDNNSTKLVIRWRNSNGNYNRNYITLSKIKHSIGNGAFEIGNDGSIAYDEKVEEKIDESTIYNQILDTLYTYNPVFNVNKNKINTGTYNNDLINDDILYTYLTSTQMEGSWFTTNYIDEAGEEVKAENPKGMFNPSNKEGTRVLLGNKEYTVIDDNIYDRTGKLIKPSNSNLIKDIAHCNNVYGDRSNDINMLDNKVLLHNGTIGLDRTTNKYITGKALEQLKYELNELPKKQARLVSFINSLNEDQAKVKRDTDGKPDTSENENGESVYRILEDDGNYYEYKRVHSIIGDQWTDEAKESFKKNEPSLALTYGNLIDDLSRNFFSNNGNITKPDNMSDEAFNRLLGHLKSIKTNIENRGESFLTNRIVVFYKYPDGTRVAGELDALSINSITGESSIYDFKTSKYTFHGEKSLFDKKGQNQIRSTKDQYSLQLSSYKNIIESKYNIEIKNLALIPSVISYDKNGIKTLATEKDILLPYVNSPIGLSYISGKKLTPVNTNTVLTSTPNNTVKGTFILEGINGKDKVTADIIPFEEVNGHKYYYYKHELPKSEKTGERLYRHYLILESGKSIDMTSVTTEDNSDNKIFNEIFRQVKQNHEALEKDVRNYSWLGHPVVTEVKEVKKNENKETQSNDPMTSLLEELSKQVDEVPEAIGFEINTDGTVDYGDISNVANQLASVNPTNTEFLGNNIGDAPVDLSKVDLNTEASSTDYTKVEYEKLPQEFRNYLETAMGANKDTWESLSEEDKQYHLHCFGI